jgi:hypothetical protein
MYMKEGAEREACHQIISDHRIQGRATPLSRAGMRSKETDQIQSLLDKPHHN